MFTLFYTNVSAFYRLKQIIMQEISPIKNRILQYIEKQGISKYKFYQDTGITRGVLDKNSGISEGNIAKFIAYYKEISPKWLLTGSGDMIKKQTYNLKEDPAPYSGPAISKSQGVPYFDVDFIGGFDLVFNDQSFTPSYYIDFPPFNTADYWVNITGKSMSPFISHGDIVALKKMDNWQQFLLFGEIYAIVTNEFRTIKIIGKGDDKDHYNLIPYSKSPEFSTQPIPKNIINHVFKVQGSIKKFF
jgi:SOS-response transcriptional repressor LexA